MDGDDVMHPDRLRIQQEALTAADDRTVVGSRAYSIDAESNVVGLHRVKKSSSSGFGVRHALINPTVMGYTTRVSAQSVVGAGDFPAGPGCRTVVPDGCRVPVSRDPTAPALLSGGRHLQVIQPGGDLGGVGRNSQSTLWEEDMDLCCGKPGSSCLSSLLRWAATAWGAARCWFGAVCRAAFVSTRAGYGNSANHSDVRGACRAPAARMGSPIGREGS